MFEDQKETAENIRKNLPYFQLTARLESAIRLTKHVGIHNRPRSFGHLNIIWKG